MTEPKNTEDQELSLDQLQDAAGGIVHPQYRDRLGGAGGKLKDVIITSVNRRADSITVDPKTGDKAGKLTTGGDEGVGHDATTPYENG